MNECKKTTCIDCSVKNCVHHSDDDHCTADKISIGNRSACSCKETCCDTFAVRR